MATEYVATVREEKQVTIPHELAERYGIEPGRRLVFVDDGEGTFTVHILPRSYAGSMPGVYGKNEEESLAYIRELRDSWG